MSELYKYLGYEPEQGNEEDVEQFKSFFQEKYIAKDSVIEDRELVSKIEGNRIGGIKTKAKQLFGDEIGLTRDELRSAKVEDVLGKIKETYDTKISEIENNTKQGTDQRITTLQSKLDEKDKHISKYKESLTELETEYNSFKQSAENEKLQFLTRYHLNEVKSKIPFKEGMSEIEKAGYESLISNNFKFSIDEDKLKVTDANGNPIKSNSSAAKFAEPYEALMNLAEKQNLIKKNNAKGTKFSVYDNTKTDSGKTLNQDYLKLKSKVFT